jgi:hypothetical protein
MKPQSNTFPFLEYIDDNAIGTIHGDYSCHALCTGVLRLLPQRDLNFAVDVAYTLVSIISLRTPI